MKLVVLAIALAAGGAAVTAQSQPLDGARVLDILNDRVNNQRQAVGIAVGILSPEGRRLVAVGNLGLTDGREIDADTVFEIGGLAELVQRELAQPAKTPLTMPSTSATPTPEMAARMASGHSASLAPVQRSSGSALYSTIADLLNLAAAIAERPRADAEMVCAEGQTDGFASAIAVDPAAKTAVIVLSNAAAGVGDIARHVLRPSIPLAKPVDPAGRKTIDVDDRILDAYVGKYAAAAGAIYTVARDGAALTLTLPGLPPLRLLAEGPRQFSVAENSRVSVSFSVTAAGSVSALVLKSPTGSVTAKKM